MSLKRKISKKEPVKQKNKKLVQVQQQQPYS